jgi:Prokaryotic N-terminal methylation motif
MNRNAGFSLLEVLAALVVTTLLILALTPLVSFMLTTWVRGGDVAGIVELRVRGVGVLRDDLRHAIIWAGFGRTENLPAFRGNETSMSFPAVSGLGEGQAGIEMLSIGVASSADGRSLIRRRAPIVGTTYTAFADPVVLFSGPFKYFLRYYSSDGSETSDWHDPLSLPSRVVLNIVDGRGRTSSVAITMPILTSISAACLASGHLPGCPVLSKPKEEDGDPLNAFGKAFSQ